MASSRARAAMIVDELEERLDAAEALIALASLRGGPCLFYNGVHNNAPQPLASSSGERFQSAKQRGEAHLSTEAMRLQHARLAQALFPSMVPKEFQSARGSKFHFGPRGPERL